LIYLHIPKAAGLTLSVVMQRHYKRSEIIEFNTLKRGIDSFGEVPREERARAKLVLGHLHYGVDRWLPSNTGYIAVLRDPVSRVVSLYRYILREPRHPLHRTLVASRVSLEKFVETGVDKTQVENGQTRQLAPVLDRDPTGEDAEIALRNLQSFVVVGLTEQFDESLILMKRQLGWRTPYYLSRNVASEDPAVSKTISSEAIELIREKNELDLELYAEAKRLFERLIDRQEVSFTREVRRFKALNRVPEVVGGRMYPVWTHLKYSAPVHRLRRAAG
jgi:hypothetical protein